MEEVLKSVTEAEAVAAQKRAAATAQADELLASSQTRANEKLKKSEEDLKRYRESALKEAEAACAQEAKQTLFLKQDEANKAADALLKDTSGIVSQIVRRILDGNRRHA